MSLSRSAVGLANKPLFHGVDAIVYVEGGSQGARSSAFEVSVDVPFWRALFSVYRPELKIRLEPKGGKPNLMPLVTGIVMNNIPNSFVALDADFDILFGLGIDHHQILYTYGYSCENDLFYPEIIAEVFFAFCHTCETELDFQRQLDLVLTGLKRSLRYLVRSDALASAINVTVIPRKAFSRLMRRIDNVAIPEIDVVFAKAQIRQVNQLRVVKFSSRHKLDIDPYRHCYGHLIDLILSTTIKHLLRRFGFSQNLDNHTIRSMAVSKLSAFLKTKPSLPVAQHYKSLFVRTTPMMSS
jgi:hypothetical protein